MEIFGDKTVVLLDLWTLQHFAFGIVAGWYLLKNTFSHNHAVIFAFVIAYAWELIEFLAEIGFFGSAIMSWFGGTEFILNRLIIDPLTLYFGVLLYRYIDIKK